MSTPPIQYPVANPTLGEAEKKYLSEAIQTDWISSAGPFIDKFEASFSKHFGPGHSVAVGNGTVAIELALLAVGVSPGDEVIVPNFTFVGSVSPIYRLHATPILAPTEAKGWSMDISKLEALLTPKTKAIVAVHLYGVPCDIEAIVAFAKKHQLKVVGDCAEALGAKVHGKHVGTFGDVSCFSFFGNKVLTTGEGGMCLTQDPTLAQQIRLYRDHGMSKEHRYWHKVIGYNGRMTNLQAAVGLGQCENSDALIQKRKELSKIYDQYFLDQPYFRQYEIPDHVEPVCWLKSPVLKSGSNLNRDELLLELRRKGIDSRPFFYPCSSMPAFSRFGLGDKHSTDIASHGFNLPTYTQLEAKDIEVIATSVNTILEKQYQPDSSKTFPPAYPKESIEEKMDVSIILPTLNEESHIVSLIETLRDQMVSINKTFEILVVDDNSTDNTVFKINETYQNDHNIFTLIRKTSTPGLAHSILEGLQQAKGEYLLVMDSNYNHDPKVAAQMAKFTEYYDIVTGSRFTTGGGMKPKLQWLLNYFGNLTIRLSLSLPTQDNLSGFFCIKRRVLNQLPLSEIFRHHGDYFFRMLFQIHQRGLSILEIPYISHRMPYVNSKKAMSSKIPLYLKEILKVRFQRD